MEKKIHVSVLSREEIERTLVHPEVAIISIYTPGDMPANITGKNPIIRLAFSDIREEEPYRQIPPSPRLMTEAQAESIIRFVDKCLSNGIKHFLAHCDAGISRSTGVAVALQYLYNNELEIPYRWQLYNPMIFEKLLKAKGVKAEAEGVKELNLDIASRIRFT